MPKNCSPGVFWRPQVALLVNARTFIPVFIELAPAAKLLDRVPAAIETALRAHGVEARKNPSRPLLLGCYSD